VTLLQNFPRKSIGKQAGEKMGVFAAVGVLLPFPYYYWLWTNPQAWVNLCGKDKNPSKVMSHVSHFLKLLQFISLFSVSPLSWPPPLYFWPLFGFGQFLNFRSVNHCTIYI
jgi:methylene-fatty-acyl-phospholipid synthase